MAKWAEIAINQKIIFLQLERNRWMKNCLNFFIIFHKESNLVILYLAPIDFKVVVKER